VKRDKKGWPARASDRHSTFNVAAIDRALSNTDPSAPDVVDRLRTMRALPGQSLAEVMYEAADEIERLRKGECICLRCGQNQKTGTSPDF
jgi:hypothetical protein